MELEKQKAVLKTTLTMETWFKRFQREIICETRREIIFVIFWSIM